MKIDFGSHADKLCSATEAVAPIKSGSRIFAGTACATPRALLHALETLPDPPHDITIYSFLTNGALPLKNGLPQSRYRHKCFFVGTDLREAVGSGAADYIPMTLAQLPSLIENGRFPIDTAFIQVSAPDCRPQLLEEAKRLGYLPTSQTLKSQGPIASMRRGPWSSPTAR